MAASAHGLCASEWLVAQTDVGVEKVTEKRDWQVRFSKSMLEGRMLRWISIFGGLLIMMGQHDRSEALFYYFQPEDQVTRKPSAAADRQTHQF